ncbi:MAG: aminoacyl-tRNA hydrolase [Simkaniaceae bacterium]
MDSEDHKSLIVGLGNPGEKYTFTRHNFGQRVLYAFAEKHRFSFKKEREFKGEIAKGTWKGGKLFLLFPTTYMNLSGQAARALINFYKISLEDVLIISDDIALPFGSYRFRTKGTAGGHNGLKSIEECLGTQDYQRLKMGIGEPLVGFLEDYVLSPFTKEEQEKLPEMITQGVTFLEEWLSKEHEGNE